MPGEVLEWLGQEVSSNDQTEHAARAAAIKQCEGELGRLRHRLNVLYEDRLDGTITKTFYDEKSKSIQAQIAEVENKLVAVRNAELPPLTTAARRPWRLTSNATMRSTFNKPKQSHDSSCMMVKEAEWKDNEACETRARTFQSLQPLEP